MKVTGIRGSVLVTWVGMLAMGFHGIVSAQVADDALRPGAPKRYVVKHGDTLWGISGVYLNDSSRWPQLWGWNQSTIKNPHRIFPGDLLVLTRVKDGFVLRPSSSAVASETKISPKVVAENSADEAIPAFPATMIEPFLDRAQVLSATVEGNTPRIVAEDDGHALMSAGNLVFADGSALDPGRTVGVYRAGMDLFDPASDEALGYEMEYVGQVVVEPSAKGAGATPLRIISSRKEVRAGDFLMDLPSEQVRAYHPHVQIVPVEGRVILVKGPLTELSASSGGFVRELEGGPMAVVVLNKGASDGVEVGSLLELRTGPVSITPRQTFGFSNGEFIGAKPVVAPASENGTVMVFRVFDGVSYGIILASNKPVKKGDGFVSP